MKIVSIIFGMLFVSSSYSQNKNIQTERNVSEYFVDTLYTQIDFYYSNTSDEPYVLWIEKESNDTLSNFNKIKKYFFTVKGDWSFMQIIWDGNVGSFEPGLFCTFMKVIKPKEQFTVSFLKKGRIESKSGILKSLEKHIEIVNAKEIKGLQIDNSIEMFNYSANNVTILTDWLK